MIEELFNRFGKDPKVGIAYIYCNFRRPGEQKPETMLASLVRQLSARMGSFPTSLKALYQEHEDRGTRPSLEELSAVLRDVVASYSSVFIVVDALDECQDDHDERSKFLAVIKDLQSKVGTKIFATSRHIPDIKRNFERSPSVEILAVDDDIRRFVRGRISRLPFLQKSPELAEEATEGIVQSAQGM